MRQIVCGMTSSPIATVNSSKIFVVLENENRMSVDTGKSMIESRDL